MTSEELLPDLRLIVPVFDSGTMAALATVTPAVDQLSVETLGSVPPPGQALTKPNAVWPPVLVTVMFRETAAAAAGIPQSPVNVQVRNSLAPNGPPVLIGTPPVPRVSTTRHGVTPMKGIGLVTSVRACTGAAQFGIVSTACRMLGRKNTLRVRNSFLCLSTEHLREINGP